jgi:hypothetical protein
MCFLCPISTRPEQVNFTKNSQHNISQKPNVSQIVPCGQPDVTRLSFFTAIVWTQTRHTILLRVVTTTIHNPHSSCETSIAQCLICGEVQKVEAFEKHLRYYWSGCWELKLAIHFHTYVKSEQLYLKSGV